MGDAANDEQEAGGDQPNPVRKRERTQVPFPYSDLQRAVELCDKLASLSGRGDCELVALAASLDQTADGGTFRGRISSARMFGLISTASDTARLTDLGAAAIDEIGAPAAKANAFLNIPLYAKLYEQYRGHPLPQAAAIQRQMTLLGLPQKQVERARQVFAASVETAGFISNGRFVKPVVAARSDPDEREVERQTPEDRSTDERPDRQNRGNGGGSGGGKDHPLIAGLLVTLPEPGEVWEVDGRKAWLKLAASVFDMIYKKSNSAPSGGSDDFEDLM